VVKRDKVSRRCIPATVWVVLERVPRKGRRLWYLVQDISSDRYINEAETSLDKIKPTVPYKACMRAITRLLRREERERDIDRPSLDKLGVVCRETEHAVAPCQRWR
jgi:hypothetical protein